MKQFKASKGDLEGLVNIPLQIKGIHFSALFQERDDEVKVSLRSSGPVDVNQVAREHFNGGGHRNAAGGRLQIPLAEVEKMFEELLPGLVKQTKPVTV
jgi:phosphoesterase RecJ-like protein